MATNQMEDSFLIKTRDEAITAMAPFYMSNPDFDARTSPPNAVETLQASMNRYERKTGKTEWVDRFWKRAKPWRVTIRRIDEVQA